MHIMFVDDRPEEKIDPLINRLIQQEVNFTSRIIGDSESAIQYISKHANEIDLAVIDLGLPQSNDGSFYDMLRGLDIIDFICENYPQIHVIINSTTEIPKEKLKYYGDKLIIKHCHSTKLCRKTLLDFTKQGFIHLIEPNIAGTGQFVFWIDSEDKFLVEKHFNQLKVNISKLSKNDNASVTTTLSDNKITLTCNNNSELWDLLEFIVRTQLDYMVLFEEMKD